MLVSRTARLLPVVERHSLRAVAGFTRNFSKQVRRDPAPMNWSLLMQEQQQLTRDIGYYKGYCNNFNLEHQHNTEQWDYYQFTQQKLELLKKRYSQVELEMNKLQLELNAKEEALEATMKSLEPYKQSETLASIKGTINSLIKWVKPDTDIMLYEAPVTDLVVFRTEEITNGIKKLQENEQQFVRIEQETYDLSQDLFADYAHDEAILPLLFELGKEVLTLLNNARDVSTTIWELFSTINGSTLGDLSALNELKEAPKVYERLKAKKETFNAQQKAYKQAPNLAAQIKAAKGMVEAINSIKKDIDYLLKLLKLLMTLYGSYKIMSEKIDKAKTKAQQKIEAQEVIVAEIKSKMSDGIDEGKVVSEMLGKALELKNTAESQIAAFEKLKQLQERIGKNLDEIQEEELKQLEQQLIKHNHTLVRLEKQMMDIDKKMSKLHDLRIMNEDTLQNLQNNVPSTSDVIIAEAASLQQKITAVFTEVGTSIENLIENPTLEKAIELQQKIEKMPKTLNAIPLVDPLV